MTYIRTDNQRAARKAARTMSKQKPEDTIAKMKRKKYEKEIRKLQTELCLLQQWVVHAGLRAIVVFEGRDAAGKGGTIKAITERVSPRIFRVVALPAPPIGKRLSSMFNASCSTSRQPGRWSSSTAAWYNRVGVEYVMEFCTKDQYKSFVEICPIFKNQIVKAGIILIKFWMEVGQEEQQRRFEARIEDPLRQWKLSPMDLESYARWYAYSRARDLMLEATDTKDAPWYIVRSDDKRRARLNCISHLLDVIPYKEVPRDKVKLPKRSDKGEYDDQASLEGRHFVTEKY